MSNTNVNTAEPAPRRGGSTRFGFFLGGSPMNISYQLISPLRRFISQVRDIKILNSVEQRIHTRRNDTTSPKFKGKLDIDSSPTSSTELNKTAFEDELKDLVNQLGLETFYYVPDPTHTEMIYLPEDAHRLTLDAVIDEYTLRMNEPSPVMSDTVDADGVEQIDTNGDPIQQLDANSQPVLNETAASIQNRFICYDTYEVQDIQLSRSIVDSLISPELRQQVKTRYKHDPDFLDYPGSVYLMMIYEVVNASTTLDIATATTSFKALSLVNYPGENISAFADESLRLINIMNYGYALPYQTGSGLLEKVHETQSVYFNMRVQTLLHEARTMENSIGPIADPKSITRHADYATRGPIGLCGELQVLYSDLLKSSSWPALSTELPSSNFASAPRNRNQTETDDYNDAPSRDNSSNNGNSSNRNDGNQRSPIMLPPGIWKYIHPKDPDQVIIIRDAKYYFCAKCSCARTGKVGMYNLTHSTSQHQRGVGQNGNNRRNQRNTSTASPGSSPPSDSNARDNDNESSANLSASVPMTKPPASAEESKKVKFDSDEASLDSDPDGFTFQGAFMHEASPHDLDIEGAWMSAVDDGDDDEAVDDVPPPTFASNSSVFGSVPPPPAVNPPLSRLARPDDEAAQAFLKDPYATAAIQLALATVQNKARCDGVVIEPLIELEDDNDIPVAPAFNPTTAPSADDHLQSVQQLAEAASNPDPNWPANVVSAIPGYTLYNLHSPTLVQDNLHAPAHCDFCGRLGDWMMSCRCAHGVHNLSDDGDYSDGHLGIHWDSDLDTAEFLQTDEEDSDDEDGVNDGSIHADSGNDTNNTISAYSQSTNHCSNFLSGWWFLLSFSQALSMLLSYSFCSCASLLISSWSYLSILLLFLAAILWDTLHYYLDPASPTQPFRSRRTRRHLSRRRQLPLRAYSKSWMLLSFFMLFLTVPVSPASASLQAIQATVSRVTLLHSLIDITPSVHLQYSYSRLHELQSMLAASQPSPQSSSSLQQSLSPTLSPLEEPLYHEHFFLPYSSIAEMEGALVDLDYQLALEPAWIDNSFNFEDLQEPHHHILGYLHQKEEELVNPPTSQAFTALTHPTLSKVDLFPLASMPSSFPVILDSGASLAISPSEGDFIGPIKLYSTPRHLGGMAGGMNIKGIGKVGWSFKTPTGILTVHSKCYYVPNAAARLLSPQRLFCAANNIHGHFSCSESHAELVFDDVGSLKVEYDPNNHLPIAVAKNLAGVQPQLNLTILNEDNQNLTIGQKLLLNWHARFGHKGFASLQRILRGSPFSSQRFKAASQCSIPRCEICELSKAHRQPTHGHKKTINPATSGGLKTDDLSPGASVSVDHFESRARGRTLTSLGRSSSDSYVGGCIFVDHMSGYIHVEEQLGFSGPETIRAKQSFEKFALDHGILIQNYLCDNGIFKGRQFVKHLHEHNQKVKYCGVNAHHKNGVAERNIRTVSDCARALLLHASLHWKDSPISSSYWPMAVQYACYIFNHCPDSSGTSPADRFFGSTVPRHKLLDLHCWGCPVYVLDPTLQQGRKLPKWQPGSRLGVFVGLSRMHSSDVPLILNPKTGHISPQYHVVFDDDFSTVCSHSPSDDPPDFWNDIELDEHIHQVPTDDQPTFLDDTWLTPPELLEKQRAATRTDAIRQTYPPASSTSPSHPAPTLSATAQGLEESFPSPPQTIPTGTTRKSVTPPSSSLPPQSTSTTNRLSINPTPRQSSASGANSPLLRRSTRTTKNIPPALLMHEQAFLSSVLDDTRTSGESDLAYLSDIHTDLQTGEINCCDPRAFAAKHKVNDPDMPSYTAAVTGEHAEEYIAAMKNEVRQLIKQKTWTAMYRRKVPPADNGERRPILKGTWVFKLKRYPDGTPMKFKARYCVRGDLQREGIDYFETYAPVVQWSTVRLVLTLILANSWVTKQVDYTNAFAQAVLNEEVYIETPRGFQRKDGKDVLKLNNSLYGLKQAPKTFYEKLRDGLLERGFEQSMIDPCLFLKEQMICLIYVDDTIITGPDAEAIESLIHSLGIAVDDQVHTFELRDEGEVGAFLGIQIERNADKTFYLTQTGLIQKVLAVAGMANSNCTVKTPAPTTPLGLDVDGDPFSENWEYPVVIGMLLYLAQNSRPDIAFAVHQCARFTHSPKQSHAVAVKRILRYLNSTKDKGMYIKPNKSLTIDCYVDADFAGLWKSEDDQDPLCVKSRSGFLITFMGCPLHWQSKLQTQIALSTMESEYIALSQAMREIIGFREILKEIYAQVLLSSEEYDTLDFRTISKTFGEIPVSTVHEDNEACLKFASVPKMSPRTKHIAIPYHFFRSRVANGEIKIVGVTTDNQLADQFTKGLSQDKFLRDRYRLIGW